MAEKFPPGAASPLRGHRVIAAYWRFMQALEARPDPKIVSDDPKIERGIWEAVEAVFRAHTSYFRTDAGLPFPHEVSWFVADAISELLAGGEPESWRTFRHTGKHSGSPKRAARERDYVRSAVWYIKAAEQCLIDDREPKKTVRDTFGVAPSTLRGWCADPEFKDINPSLLDATDPSFGRTLRAMMLDHGLLYREARRTRSQSAISSRDAKRKA